MSDIDVIVKSEQPINIELNDQPINVDISQSSPINVELSEQEINVEIGSDQPLNVQLAEAVVVADTIIESNLYIQETQPTTDENYLWVETENGNVKTFWVETGA